MHNCRMNSCWMRPPCHANQKEAMIIQQGRCQLDCSECGSNYDHQMTEQHDAKKFLYRLLVHDRATYIATTATVCVKQVLW